MAETNVADALVEYLSSRGVENIFGVLAHTSFAIGDAIAKRPHMRFVNAQHEGGAGNMALGYARATKKPATPTVVRPSSAPIAQDSIRTRSALTTSASPSALQCTEADIA